MNAVIFKRIMLQTPQDVKNFCYSVSSLPRNVSVKVKHDTYVVDGKSILGMFSLDLSNPVLSIPNTSTHFTFAFHLGLDVDINHSSSSHG